MPDLGRRTLVMGILNVTPDSFSDGGQFFSLDDAAARAEQMREGGADIVDIGGESTRPGAAPISAEEEIARVVPVIARLAGSGFGCPLSVDTTKAAVARAALDAGAHLINDVSAGTLDAAMLQTVAALGVPYILMHLPVAPRQMGWSRAGGGLSADDDVIAVAGDFLAERIAAARAAGIARPNLVADPGFGFGKTARQNLDLLRRLPELRARVGGDIPLLLGTSRKSTLARVLEPGDEQADPERRAATAASVALSVAGGADIVRVHDVAFMTRVVRFADAVTRSGGQN